MVDTQNIYAFIRNLAVNKLECEIFRKLHIIYNSQTCNRKRAYNHDHLEIPNKLYSWKIHDYVERRKLDNCVWLDVLKKDISSDCLQTLKLKTDLVELLHYMTSVFIGLVGGTIDFNLQADIVEPLIEANEFLKVFESITRINNKNRDILNKYIKEKSTFDIIKRDSAQEAFKLKLEDRLVNNDVWFPIEIRFQLRHYQGNLNQMIHKCESDEDKLDKQIKMFAQMQQTESYCSQCVMNMYYTQIENYKNRIAEFNALYDIEYEKVDNKISYKKLSLDKLREQRNFFKEQLQRFRDELHRIEQMEIAAKEAEELRKQMELEELEAKALLKNAKGNKKDKNAKKTKKK